MAIKSSDAGASQGTGDKTFVFRDIVPDEIEAKGKKGKAYLFKIKDSDGKWYTVWGDAEGEKGVIGRLNKANDNGETVFVAVEISKDGKYTNYTIRAVDKEAKEMQSQAPAGGGQSGGGGGGYSPEDIKRMTNLALMKMATNLAAAATDVKDKEATLKQQVMVAEQFDFLTKFFEQSLKGRTPAKADEQMPLEEEATDEDADDDIPF